MEKIKGFLIGLLSSSSFGLIPLFSLPLMAAGIHIYSILMYRFFIASVAVGLIMIAQRESFRINIKEAGWLFLLSVLYFFSALFLLVGYEYMASGVATVIHFLYPVFVTLILFIFFKQRSSFITFLAIAFAIVGVAFLTGVTSGVTLSPIGVIIVAISGLSYALYIITVNKSRLREMKNMKLTFYVMLMGGFLFFLNTQLKGDFQLIESRTAWINILLLSLVPTVLSNVALLEAVKRIGSTTTAVLGALEPLTAVIIGIIVFQEPFSINTGIGIALVFTAVTLIIFSGYLNLYIKERLRHIKRRIAGGNYTSRIHDHHEHCPK